MVKSSSSVCYTIILQKYPRARIYQIKFPCFTLAEIRYRDTIGHLDYVVGPTLIRVNVLDVNNQFDCSALAFGADLAASKIPRMLSKALPIFIGLLIYIIGHI